MHLDALFTWPFALHAGTLPVVSQTILTLMLVVLGIVLIGISFGYLVKSKESLQQHRWILTGAVAMVATAVALVMLPTFVNFYVDPDVQVFSSLSIVTLIHGIIGVPAMLTAIAYALGLLPTNVKTWMRITAVIFVTTIALGVLLFLQMMEIV